MSNLLLVVEGEGDVDATRLLMRRVLAQFFDRHDYKIHVHRRHDLCHLRANDWANFKRYFNAAHAEECPIIWLLDCDDGCALDWLRNIYKVVAQLGLRQPLAFVFWVREYEAMFLYDLESIKEKLGIEEFHDIPADPQAKRGVKEWISSQLPSGFAYRESLDQERLTAVVDLEKIKTGYRSFEHLIKATEWILQCEDSDIYPAAL
ncbi:MAG TPA: DUF4276 family protein [Gammaproteobacteria bacterium]|jgi:hypothetical protein|nr:DUF4276 family protein [Gammaproteobacteria bacterium]